MGKKGLLVVLIIGMLLSGCASKSSSTGSTSGASGSSDTNITGALNLVLGTTDRASVFSSYHIELTLDTPKLNDDNTAVINEVTQISADVEGANVHIVQLDPGATETKEGYIIGDTEYKLVDGEKVDTMGFIALGWAMWPLQVIVPYSYSAYWSTPAGTDTVDGRAADVYTFDSEDASAASQSVMESAGLTGMTNAKGKVWIDQQTGGMLKLDMTYTDKFAGDDGTEIGDGTGTVTLEISGVNQTQVVEP